MAPAGARPSFMGLHGHTLRDWRRRNHLVNRSERVQHHRRSRCSRNGSDKGGVSSSDLIVAATGLWFLCSIAFLYPIFQTILLRWWVSGLRFGDVAVKSQLRIPRVFGVYARFFGYAALFTAVAGILVTAGAFGLSKAARGLSSIRGEIITTVLSLGAYAAIALGYWTIYQATVKLGVWRCVVESLEISNSAVLEQVAAAGEAASPVGEGLADALNVGGI